MANVTITPAAVLKSATAEVAEGIAGATIVQGDWLYADAAASNTLKLADATSSAKSTVVGMALTAASSGQPVKYLTVNDVTMDGLTQAQLYVLSVTAGKMCPRADLSTGNWVTVLGAAKSATVLKVAVSVLGIQVP